MNCNIYIYGEFNDGYTQYPNNYTKNIIKEVVSKLNDFREVQIVIYRTDTTIYVVYNYNYHKNKTFGFCLEYNRVCPVNIDYLYSFFNSIVTDILNKGILLHYTTSGDIISEIKMLYDHMDSVEFYFSYIHSYLDEKKSEFIKLPTKNIATSQDNTIVLYLDNPCNTIEAALHDYGIIIVTNGTENESINSYKNILIKLQDKNTAQTKKNKELLNEIHQLKLEKKRLVYVIILSFILLFCCIGIYILYNNLSETQHSLEDAYQNIDNLKDTIQAQNAVIIAKDYMLEREQANIRKLNDSVTLYKDKVYSTQEQLTDKILELENSHNQLIKKDSELTELTHKHKKIVQKSPFIITDIKIRNETFYGKVISEYGQPIYSNKTRFLCFGINIRPFIDAIGKEYTLNVKLFKNDILRAPNNSPYTFSTKIKIDQSTDIHNAGWGYDTDGFWSSGTYRYEIWYDEICLGKKTFTVF